MDMKTRTEPPVSHREINIDAINKTSGVTPRVQACKQRYLKEVSKVSSDRPWYLMESYKQTEGQHEAVRRAKAFAHVWDNQSIRIFDHDLIVANWTDSVRGAYPALENYPEEMRELLEKNEAAWTNSQSVAAALPQKDFDRLLECAKYWEAHFPNEEQKVRWPKLFAEMDPDDLEHEWKYTGVNMVPEPRPKGKRLKRIPFLPRINAAGSDFDKMLKIGYKGFIQEAKDHIEKIKDGARGRAFSNEENDKLAFLDSAIISLEGMIRHAKRYAALAQQEAEKQQDPKRKTELEKVAAICRWVPENPARTFNEALQAVWFTVLGIHMDKCQPNVFLARFDQYLFPYYMADINEGRMTRQEAAELLGCFIIKLTELEPYMTPSHRQLSQGTNYENITIGGVDRNNRDASNELSCLVLHVAKDTKTHQPYISLRWNNKIAPELMDKAFECNRAHGGGIPAFFSDQVNIEYMLGRGHSIGDARDYAIAGCINVVYPPTFGWVRINANFFNIAKMLELTLHNGIDPRTGIRIGLETGDPHNFKTFEELVDAQKRQIAYFTNTQLDHTEYLEKSGTTTTDCQYYPFISALMDGPIANGKDVSRLGARVTIDDGAFCVDRFFQDTSDSLVAIKKLVFEQKKYSMDDVIKAIDADWAGYEQLRADCLAQPKYGNDDDEADLLMNELWCYSKDLILARRDAWGRKYTIMRNGSAMAQVGGRITGALPNGRKAGAWLADAGLSPGQQMDRKGPTAVFNSVCKIDVTDMDGTLLNMKIAPSLLDKKGGMEKFQQLVKTYFDQGGMQIQFNILDREKLLAAQKNPQDYRDLVVRVAGYSAFWVDLDPIVQNEIIGRTEQVF